MEKSQIIELVALFDLFVLCAVIATECCFCHALICPWSFHIVPGMQEMSLWSFLREHGAMIWVMCTSRQDQGELSLPSSLPRRCPLGRMGCHGMAVRGQRRSTWNTGRSQEACERRWPWCGRKAIVCATDSLARA